MKKLLILLYCAPLICLAQNKTYENTVLLNGKIPLLSKSSYTDVRILLGQPDSIKRNTAECGSYFDAADDLIFFHGVVFEKNKDTMGISHIDFTSSQKTFVQFGPLKLTAGTALKEIEAHYKFPAEQLSKEIEDMHLGKRVQIVVLDVSPKLNDDAKWNLIFYHGKLVRLELWFPC